MGIFTGALREVRAFMKDAEGRNKREFASLTGSVWPAGGDKNLVMAADVGVELGNPQEESVSFVLWTEEISEIHDGRITLIGPDIPESRSQSRPFGKVILLSGRGFDEGNTYERYRQLDGLRFDLDLKGYMLRAASVYQKEWIRISRVAVEDGFSFRILGTELIHLFRRMDYIDAAEVLFVTSGPEDMTPLKGIATGAGRIIAAMGKMVDEWSMDCDACEYEDVCNAVEDLKRMRDQLMKGAS